MNEIFYTTANQMLIFFIIMIIGYVLAKKKIVGDSADKALSSILTYAICPALTFKTFYENFRLDVMKEKLGAVLISFAILVILYIFACFLARVFTKNDYLKKIYAYSLVVANYGYMGYAVTESVFGGEALFNMMLFTIPITIFIYTIGVSSLDPNSKKITFKSVILRPAFILMFIGMMFGALNIKLPIAIEKASASISSCMGPMAMLMTGIVIAKYNFKEIILNWNVTIISVIRLIIIPSVLVIALRLCGVSEYIQIAVLGSYAMPMGLNTVVFPAAFGGDTKPGASMALISNIMAIITIPVMFSIFS